MTDPEYPETKNEQELNLFADQPQPEAGDAETRELAAESSPAMEVDASDVPQTPETNPETDPGTDPGTAAQDDEPVIAPPSRKSQTPGRGGVSAPPQRNRRPGRAGFPPVAAASASGSDTRKPLSIQSVQTLGQTLTAIRNARGLSIEEVALATRIRLEYLTELEADELLKVLPTVYVSAYVRKLIDIYDLSREDSELLIEKMHGEIPQDPEDLPDKLLESVNEGGMVNEGENKRIRNITILFFSGVAVIFIAIVWLIILLVVRHSRKPDASPDRTPAAVTSGEVAAPAGESAADDGKTDDGRITEADFDALITPETLDPTVLKMNDKRGIREKP